MTVAALLLTCQKAGIHLAADGETLEIDAPRGALTPDLRDQLAHHKTALLEALRPPRAFVTLKNGPTLPVEVIELAVRLEAQGVPLRADANHQFVMPEHPSLTAQDLAAIHRWRLHLGAIVEYEAPEPV